jgi:glucose-fructose oxidoreductase
MHHQYARRALRKGIHVLCEKPLALDKNDCLDLIQAAEASKAKFMTAYRLHFEPANLKAIEMIQKQKIGEVRYFNSSFSFKIKDRNNIRLKNETGGGPLWDIGIYCINAARYLLQSEPLEVMALAAAGNGPEFQEVDETVGVTMKFPRERIANFVCSFGASEIADFQVFGTKGSLHLESAYEYAMPRKLTLKTERGQKTFRFPKGDQFAPELIYFSDCILKNKEIEPSGYEGLADVRIIQALYESASTGKSVRLQTQETLREKRRPSAKQKFREPPVAEVSTVGVRSPS